MESPDSQLSIGKKITKNGHHHQKLWRFRIEVFKFVIFRRLAVILLRFRSKNEEFYPYVPKICPENTKFGKFSKNMENVRKCCEILEKLAKCWKVFQTFPKCSKKSKKILKSGMKIWTSGMQHFSQQ